MDKVYSYDPCSGSLWSWDGDFHFDGKVNRPSIEAMTVPSEDHHFCEAIGALFLSGGKTSKAIVRYDDSGHAIVWTGKPEKDKAQDCEWKDIYGVVRGSLHRFCPIVLCGSACANPKTVAEFCKSFPYDTVRVCTLIDELASFGNLVLSIEDRPRRVPMCMPNLERLDLPCVEFDQKLDGDGLGKMAYVINKGGWVYNDMCKVVGIKTFYGCVLNDGINKGNRFIVKTDEMDRFFPYTQISAKCYAAESVFVSMEPSDEFRKISGVTHGPVYVMVATEYIEGLPTFMRFYKAMSGRGFIGSNEVHNDDFNNGMPVFRHDRAYRMK